MDIETAREKWVALAKADGAFTIDDCLVIPQGVIPADELEALDRIAFQSLGKVISAAEYCFVWVATPMQVASISKGGPSFRYRKMLRYLVISWNYTVCIRHVEDSIYLTMVSKAHKLQDDLIKKVIHPVIVVMLSNGELNPEDSIQVVLGLHIYPSVGVDFIHDASVQIQKGFLLGEENAGAKPAKAIEKDKLIGANNTEGVFQEGVILLLGRYLLEMDGPDFDAEEWRTKVLAYPDYVIHEMLSSAWTTLIAPLKELATPVVD